MFDYVNRMQLALGDKARRAGMKAGASVALLIGAGFLLAALWSWLAWHLELGPAYASLIIGGAFAVIGLIVWLASSKEKHAVPSADDLRSEVETRVGLATEAAIDRVKYEAGSAVEGAKAKVSSLFGGVADKVSNVAHGAGDLASGAGKEVSKVASKGGELLSEARETLDTAMEPKAGPGIGLAGAFAVGMVLAGALSRSRSKDDFYYDDDEWEDDYYY
ncbi:MAG: phage holin family protein [Paracoccus denitrificans]|uniref:Phage holin family protein n=1 Tax=Paracoccus denitrificans TaxID=266 RepID=A0A533I620_PARDE|nr:MAG: phage holin family protein [Paracoccus denitrificans]